MIIRHRFPNSALQFGGQKGCGQIDAIWPKHSGQTLMVGFDGPTSLFGFDDEPHMAIYLPFDHVRRMSRETFASLGTKLVLTPLLTSEFDAMELATILESLGYRGAYRAVINNIPNATMVQREILSHYPGMDFDVVEIGDCRVRKLPRARGATI